MSQINTASSQISITEPIEKSLISLENSYPDLNFGVLHAATGNRCTDGNDIRLVNLGPNALFSSHMLTTSSGKHLEDFNNSHIVPIKYTLGLKTLMICLLVLLKIVEGVH